MRRDAKLFFLTYKRWEPLAEKIDNDRNFRLKNDITIFQLPHDKGENENYAILSLSDEVDKLVEESGAEEAHEKDLLRIVLHEYDGTPLYGEKSNLIYLNKALT